MRLYDSTGLWCRKLPKYTRARKFTVLCLIKWICLPPRSTFIWIWQYGIRSTYAAVLSQLKRHVLWVTCAMIHPSMKFEPSTDHTLRLPFLTQQNRFLWFETRPCPQKDLWGQKLFLAPVNCGYSNLVVLRTFVCMGCCWMSVLYRERKVTQEKEKWGRHWSNLWNKNW